MTVAQSSSQALRRRNGNQLGSTVTLAFWQLRQVWRLLTLTTLGMIAAVVLACAIPLFSRVTMSAGLRHGLNNPPDSAYIMVHSTAHRLSPGLLTNTTGQLNSYFQQNLGKYLTEQPEFSLRSGAYVFQSGDGAQKGPLAKYAKDDQMQLVGMDVPRMANTMKLVQGRFPAAGAKEFEIALAPEVATYMKVQPGAEIVLQMPYANEDGNLLVFLLKLRVVGTFKVLNQNDVRWHGATFASDALKQGYYMKALIPNQTLAKAFGSIPEGNPLLSPPDLLWYYHINTNRIDATNMDDLLLGLNNLPVDVPAYTNSPPSMEQAQVIAPTDAVQEYRDRIAVAQIPVVILGVLIVCLLLFFQSLMAELLIDRQSSTIALLRSRGSSGRQIFGAFIIQSLLIAALAFVIGPLLAIPAVRLLVQRILAPSDQSALNLIEGSLLQVAYELRWFALIVVAASVLTLIFSVYRMTKFDVLALRRESARTTRRPFWQRFYLDFIAILVAGVSYIFSFYLKQTGLLDAQLQVQLQAPLTLVSSVCLLIGCSLLFVRLFPFILQLGGRLSSRSRAIGPTLALAQMARAPYQTIRMTLLLMFALAFVVFTLVFNASQAQHILDVAAYQTGADFSGTLASNSLPAQPLKDQQSAFSKLRGVEKATVGYIGYVHTTASSYNDVTVKMLAVDPATFVDATFWPDEGSLQNLKAQVRQLSTRQAALIKLIPTPAPTPTPTAKGTPKAATGAAGVQTTPTVTATATAQVPAATATAQAKQKQAAADTSLPAIVDDATWELFKLAPGKRFTMLGPQGSSVFIALGHVAHLPTVNDKATGANQEKGIMVDYQSFAAVYAKNNSDVKNKIYASLNTNHVWLTSKQDAQSLSAIRLKLTKGPLILSDLYDRNAIIAQGQNDPLYLNIIGILTIGALAPVLLALIGNLIASWLNVRARLTNFALLRALGTSPSQLASILTWEQSFVYACAIGLGIVFGLVLSSMTMGSLVFTSAPQTGTGSDTAGTDTGINFYALQNVPPIHIVIPNSLLIVIGVLLVISILVLGLLINTVSRPTIGQTLRLNED